MKSTRREWMLAMGALPLELTGVAPGQGLLSDAAGHLPE